MEDMLTLVTRSDEVSSNFKRFNADLPNDSYLQSLLSTFRHWYYFEDLELFGPSKFIGYLNTNAQNYRVKQQNGADGRVTVYHLRKHFNATLIDDEQIKAKLKEFLATYDKSPNKQAKIHSLAFPRVTIVRNNRNTPRHIDSQAR